MSHGYSRAEIIAAGDAFPARGPLCHRCGLHIPRFEELAYPHKLRILELIRHDRPIMAISELRLRTGCSPLWARIWVNHKGQPKLLYGKTLCAFCGKRLLRLKPSRARLCLHCGRDRYDDPRLNPVRIAVPIPVDRNAPCYPRG